MSFLLHLLHEGDHFVDIGANIGSYTILAGGVSKARVTAIEPISTTFEYLKRNIALNGLGKRVCANQVGLSDKVGSLRFSTDLDTVNHVLAEGEDINSVEVPVTLLDDLIGGDVPTLIKIDVEGHELSVLRGGDNTLRNLRLLAVIMETNGSGSRYGVLDDQLIETMRAHGFSPFGYNPFTRKLFDVTRYGGNTVFIRNRKQVEERLKEARRFQLINGEL